MKQIRKGDILKGVDPVTFQDKDGTVIVEKRTAIINGISIKTITLRLVDENGEYLTNRDIEKQNDIYLNNKYRKKAGLLTSDEICQIRLRRGWTQEEMSRFLSIGLKDIARYENGWIQTKCIDEMIRLVGNDKSFYPYCEVLHKEYVKPHLREKKRRALSTPSLKVTSL